MGSTSNLSAAKYWFNPYYACEISTTDPGNNLIAKENAAGDGSSLSGNFSGQVVIRSARQLANLAKATGNSFNDAPTAAQEAAQNRNYVQLLNIDYDDYTGDGLTAFTTGKSDTSRQTPAALDSGSYDGNEFFIRNLYIGDDNGKITKGIGLFGCTKGTLSDIRLVNVRVIDTDTGSNAKDNPRGALAGWYQGGTVTNCGVYVDEINKPTVFTGTSAYDTFSVTAATSKGSTGGLIGCVNSSFDMQKCFAAVKVTGYKEVGGLIGKLNVANGVTTKLTDCYAGGHTDGGDYKGESANVTGDTRVGGLIGNVATTDTSQNAIATLSGTNYSTCSVYAKDLTGKQIGLLIGDVKNEGLEIAKVEHESGAVAYATGKAFKKNNSDMIVDATADLRDESTDCGLITNLNSSDILAATRKDMDKTHPYDEYWKTAAKGYPYKSGQEDHYGDWLETTSGGGSGAPPEPSGPEIFDDPSELNSCALAPEVATSDETGADETNGDNAPEAGPNEDETGGDNTPEAGPNEGETGGDTSNGDTPDEGTPAEPGPTVNGPTNEPTVDGPTIDGPTIDDPSPTA